MSTRIAGTDHLCEHGLAQDMHCCACGRKGFLFDWADCVCPLVYGDEFHCPECGWIPPEEWYKSKSVKQIKEGTLHCWECASELFPEDEPDGIDA